MLDQSKISISGFTIVRNARILNYPFKESVLSVLELCDEFIINCGDSEDDTFEQCMEFQKQFPDKIKVFQTVWQQENQSGGWQLKAQTDAAIRKCRGNWCLYVQADEAIHEDDHKKILKAVQKAHGQEKIDGVLFNYIHFYGNFKYAIEGRNWYRREVRCFKNSRGIESFRDAQGFRRYGERIKAIESGARVFHYGYVRSSESLRTKSVEMAKWWGTKAPEDEKSFQLIRHVGLYKFKKTHPKWMGERIAQNADYFDPAKCPRKWDRREIKNAITWLWEALFHYRIGEYRNYEILG